MFITKIAGVRLAQYAIRVDLETARTLERMRKEGGFKSVNCLIRSILCEIALDESTTRDSAQDLTNKKTSPQSREVRVA